MSRLAAAGLVLALALAGPAGARPLTYSPGPFAGTIRQGETHLLTYDNDPLDQDCPQYVVYYRVSLTHAPVTDTLTLSAGGRSIGTSHGGASVVVAGSPCTTFGIAVTGAAVADRAAYVVTVTSPALADIT